MREGRDGGTTQTYTDLFTFLIVRVWRRPPPTRW